MTGLSSRAGRCRSSHGDRWIGCSTPRYVATVSTTVTREVKTPAATRTEVQAPRRRAWRQVVTALDQTTPAPTRAGSRPAHHPGRVSVLIWGAIHALAIALAVPYLVAVVWIVVAATDSSTTTFLALAVMR